MMPYLLDFKCPLCSSNHAQHVVVSRANGGEPYKTDFYQCGGCSVMFRDIARFTKLLRSVYDAEHKRIDEKEMRSEYP